MKYNDQQGGLESPLAFEQGSGDTLGNPLGGIDSRVEQAMRLKAVRSDMKNNCTLFAVQLNVCGQLHTGVILCRVMILQLSPYHSRRDNEMPGLSLSRTIPKCTCPGDVRKLPTPRNSDDA
ncbi:hypothetical protein G5I_09241 [Acromyrmex echinatior]|uniref:Uncharacterized protein n=1 Tax=Acromyrmex echinatior TaxID=103372 RepID=F4WTN5_ACREC|nr:hypothetical protein G5I_09241 [Acromyrmex echinatior]